MLDGVRMCVCISLRQIARADCQGASECVRWTSRTCLPASTREKNIICAPGWYGRHQLNTLTQTLSLTNEREMLSYMCIMRCNEQLQGKVPEHNFTTKLLVLLANWMPSNWGSQTVHTPFADVIDYYEIGNVLLQNIVYWSIGCHFHASLHWVHFDFCCCCLFGMYKWHPNGWCDLLLSMLDILTIKPLQCGYTRITQACNFDVANSIWDFTSILLLFYNRKWLLVQDKNTDTKALNLFPIFQPSNDWAFPSHSEKAYLPRLNTNGPSINNNECLGISQAISGQGKGVFIIEIECTHACQLPHFHFSPTPKL